MPIYQFVVIHGDHEDGPSVRGHICLMKKRRDGTVTCSLKISNRVDAVPIPPAFGSW